MNLDTIKGIGPKVINNLSKLGIFQISDLWDNYPYRFDILKRTPISDLGKTERVILH